MKKTMREIQGKYVRAVMFVAMLLVAVFACTMQVNADDGVKPKKITAVGKKSITVSAGEEFELKVKMTPRNADDDKLRWKIISGKKYVRFEDDTTDDEVELVAKKVGTAKIRCRIQGTKKQVIFNVKVKAATKKIKMASPKKCTVEVGDDFELKVKKYAGLKDRHLVWSIADTSIVEFEYDDDEDHADDEMEFYANKIGKTTVTCKNKKTGQTLKFTVQVVKETVDDYDD